MATEHRERSLSSSDERHEKQALPGPLFNFAAYLGAVIAGPDIARGLFGALVWWCGLFGPAQL